MALNTATALGTLAKLKARLRITVNTYDTLLEDAITVASSLIAQSMHRPLGYVAAQVDYVVGDGTTELLVKRPPVWSIASVSIDGAALDASEYECVSEEDKYGGVIINSAGWRWTTMLAGEGAARDPLPGHERRSWKVTYAGGYQLPGQNAVAGVDALPAHIEEACYRAAAYFFAQMSSDPTVQSESLLSYSATYGAAATTIGRTGLPIVVEAMLAGDTFPSQA
jgi:hypothetical protein